MLAFPYTHDNHFRYGYDGQWFVNRTSRDQVLQHTYGKVTRQIDLRTAALHAAELIANSTDKQIFVTMSGGIDSEAVASSFLSIGADFTAAIMRFSDGDNQHDIRYAEKYCRDNNIPIRYFDINPKKFWFSKDATRIVEISQCYVPGVICTMWLVEQIPGLAVIGNGDPLVYKPVDIDHYVVRESEHILAWYKHMINSNIEGIPGFHQYTPEQVLAVLDHPLTHQYVQENDTDTNEHLKHPIYAEAFPGMEVRQSYTGVEYLVSEAEKARNCKLKRAYNLNIQEDRIPYYELLGRLKGGLVGPDGLEPPTSSV